MDQGIFSIVTLVVVIVVIVAFVVSDLRLFSNVEVQSPEKVFELG